MANLSVALALSRASLNDVAATLWDDTALIPHVAEAHMEMQLQLELNGLPVTSKESTDFVVNAGITTLTSPVDLIDPINLKEKAIGDPPSFYVDMTRQSFVPVGERGDSLNYWTWNGEQFQFLGATTNRDVRIYYLRGITVPVSPSDPIGFIWGESFLGPRVAALAAGRVGNWSAHDKLTERAMRNIDTIVRMNVKAGQSLPVRKRPFMWRFKRTRYI